MNLNYVGSLAERFMKFRSSLATEENISENLFNAISIYVPKSLASNNLVEGSYQPLEITEDKYAVISVTVDNYNDILKGELKAQWKRVFNDGANSAVTLYIIVFNDDEFAVTTTASTIEWSPLTKAFKDLYFISFFKVLFSEKYNGNADGDKNFFDMALCLSALCEDESALSMCLTEVHLTVPEDDITDTNACKILTQTRGDETTQCTSFTGSDSETRAQYFWGYLLLLGFNHTMLEVHNGSYMLPIILGKWFERPNSSNEYIGNKLAKIRLSGAEVKPTGIPSPLDSDVNLNLSSKLYKNLDDKNVGYFISISGSSRNNAELIRERTGQNYPVTAYMMSRFIDYQTSQDIANFVSSNETLTNPVLTNEEAYKNIQSMLVANIQKFTGTKRITSITLNFPPFAKVKEGNSIEGTAVWSAVYVDDLESVNISGSISF